MAKVGSLAVLVVPAIGHKQVPWNATNYSATATKSSEPLADDNRSAALTEPHNTLIIGPGMGFPNDRQTADNSCL
jgi:hypothetical protein